MRRFIDFIRLRWKSIVGVGLGLLLGAISLSMISSVNNTPDNWLSFGLFFLLAAGLMLVGWYLIKKENPPGWLGFLLVGAALLRLILGVVWFLALPVSGYDTAAERRGYVMADAYDRDRAAWRLARSEQTVGGIISGLRRYKRFDQYGGMLAASALLYLYSGMDAHHPLAMVVITASFSSLAVLFTWAFSRRAWGEKTARVAAWGIALYPEAVLLGSSQMREAFLIPLIMAAFYGLICTYEHKDWISLLWVLAAMALCLPFSPPASALVMVMLLGMGLFLGREQFLGQRRLMLVIFLMLLVALVGTWFAWRSYAPDGISSPFSLMRWWLRITAKLQAGMSTQGSGWMQKIFSGTPAWTHSPLMIAYGIVRPLLPAALFDLSGALIWRAIAIWRASGWMVLLTLLVYAPFVAFRKQNGTKPTSVSITRGLSLVIWLGILTAAIRGGADEWDNVRYRAMFNGLQVALAAWVWVCYQENQDAWFKRLLVSIGIVLAWMCMWYLRRYTNLNWPVDDFFTTIGLGIASAGIYLAWDVLRNRRKQQ